MTTLRVSVVHGLTDEEIIAIRRALPYTHGDRPWHDTLAFAHEVERMSRRKWLAAQSQGVIHEDLSA